jgi:hypothetical protein
MRRIGLAIKRDRAALGDLMPQLPLVEAHTAAAKSAISNCKRNSQCLTKYWRGNVTGPFACSLAAKFSPDGFLISETALQRVNVGARLDTIDLPSAH